jgi:hypothetical protein
MCVKFRMWTQIRAQARLRAKTPAFDRYCGGRAAEPEKLWVNDVLKQDSNTGKMIFTLAEQIAQLSSRITLYHPSWRCDSDRHSGPGRRWAWRVPQARRRSQAVDRKDRLLDENDGVTPRPADIGLGIRIKFSDIG